MMDGILGDGGAGAQGGLGGPGGDGSPASACGLDGIAPADDFGGEGMILEIGGEYFDLGPGTGDADGDGTADSVTLADERGLSIYSDIDGDGTVDHVTTVLFDGTYETWTASADDGAAGAGGTRTGVSGESVAKQESPSTWGIHEWERGEHGSWA